MSLTTVLYFAEQLYGGRLESTYFNEPAPLSEQYHASFWPVSGEVPEDTMYRLLVGTPERGFDVAKHDLTPTKGKPSFAHYNRMSQ
ncbi:hypothetical protein MTO96_042019 [Rhipicephalus appendiculatus]